MDFWWWGSLLRVTLSFTHEAKPSYNSTSKSDVLSWNLYNPEKKSVQVNKPYPSYKKKVNSIIPTHRDDR
jgi:hypothetical protein